MGLKPPTSYDLVFVVFWKFLSCILICANDLSFITCVHTFKIYLYNKYVYKYTSTFHFQICTNSTPNFFCVPFNSCFQLFKQKPVDKSGISCPDAHGLGSSFPQVFQFPYAIKNWSKCVEASLTPPQAGINCAMKKKPGLLGYIGDEILPRYIGIVINHYKDPY